MQNAACIGVCALPCAVHAAPPPASIVQAIKIENINCYYVIVLFDAGTHTAQIYLYKYRAL